MDLETYASTNENPHAGGEPAPAHLLTRHTIALGYHWYIPETPSGFWDIWQKAAC